MVEPAALLGRYADVGIIRQVRVLSLTLNPTLISPEGQMWGSFLSRSDGAHR